MILKKVVQIVSLNLLYFFRLKVLNIKTKLKLKFDLERSLLDIFMFFNRIFDRFTHEIIIKKSKILSATNTE